MNITPENFPAAFAAMDEAAKEFWTYPNRDWQNNFLRQWAHEHGDIALLDALDKEPNGFWACPGMPGIYIS